MKFGFSARVGSCALTGTQVRSPRMMAAFTSILGNVFLYAFRLVSRLVLHRVERNLVNPMAIPASVVHTCVQVIRTADVYQQRSAVRAAEQVVTTGRGCFCLR